MMNDPAMMSGLMSGAGGPGMMPPPAADTGAAPSAPPMPAPSTGEDPMVETVKNNYAALSPEDKQKVAQYLTDETIEVVELLFGESVAELAESIGDKNSSLRPVPRDALNYMGEEKFNSFINKAMENMQNSKGLMSSPAAQKISNAVGQAASRAQ